MPLSTKRFAVSYEGDSHAQIIAEDERLPNQISLNYRLGISIIGKLAERYAYTFRLPGDDYFGTKTTYLYGCQTSRLRTLRSR